MFRKAIAIVAACTAGLLVMRWTTGAGSGPAQAAVKDGNGEQGATTLRSMIPCSECRRNRWRPAHSAKSAGTPVPLRREAPLFGADASTGKTANASPSRTSSRQEPRDREWSTNERAYLYAMMKTEHLERDVVEDVDCRQTLCRVVLDGSGDNMQVAMSLAQEARNSYLPFAYHARALHDGGTSVTAFIAREGLEPDIFPEGDGGGSRAQVNGSAEQDGG